MNCRMNGLALAAVVAGSFASPAIAATSEAACGSRPGGPIDHIVRVQEEGFFPTVTYACPGDSVSFYNGHWNWANFTVDYLDGTTVWSEWSGPALDYTIPNFTVSSGMNVEFRSLSSHPYYPSAYKGFLVMGVAPYDKDDL